MKTMIDFLMLRPVFTTRALRAVWYVYLIATLLRLAHFAGFSSVGGADPRYYTSLISPVLFALADLVLVRIFLEIALQFINKRPAKK